MRGVDLLHPRSRSTHSSYRSRLRYDRRARVCAALRAAIDRMRGPLVRTAFRAAADRARAPRLRAAERAWRASDDREAAAWPSRRSARWMARERVAEGFLLDRARLSAKAALRRVLADAFPLAGGASFTPARRAFERPMAMACFVERAPCFPSRMWCISSRTNSPACVVADFPSRLSSSALSRVSFSGIVCLLCEVRALSHRLAQRSSRT